MQEGVPFINTGDDLIPNFASINKWTSWVFASELLVKPKYDVRWGQRRPVDWTPNSLQVDDQPARGPWRGLFAKNVERVTRLVHIYNADDDVLSGAWMRMQRGQKPYNDPDVFGANDDADNRTAQYWGRLPKTADGDDYLFDARTNASASLTRQWAELAFWFPSLSEAAGLAPVSDPSMAQQIESLDFSEYSSPGLETSHSPLTIQPFHRVYEGWQRIGAIFGSD